MKRWTGSRRRLCIELRNQAFQGADSVTPREWPQGGGDSASPRPPCGVVEQSRRRNSRRENREPPWPSVAGKRTAGRKRRAIRPRCTAVGVVQRHRTDEASEQGRETGGGGCGWKAADQGERGTDQLVPDTGPGERAKRAGPCAASSAEGITSNDSPPRCTM